jgi:hypothetical protein
MKKSYFYAVALLSILSLSAAVARAQIGVDQDQQPRTDPPRNRGFGGIGISISLGKKKSKIPSIEMRDTQIADYIPDQIIFVIMGQASGAEKIAKAANISLLETVFLDEANVTMVVAQLYTGDSVDAATQRLSAINGVGWAQPNHQFQLLGAPYPKRFALHAVPEKSALVSGHIVMIDAPVDAAHSNLSGAKFDQRLFGVAGTPAMHGTAVAALLVGTGDYPGMAQGARLTNLSAFGEPAKGASLSRTSYLAKAMNEASKLRPDVLNLSFGGPQDKLLSVVLDAIHKNGICVAAAVGNGGGKGSVLFPASHPASLAVTAVDDKLRGYADATHGARVDIAGIGVALNAAAPGGRRSVSGTSFATAVVSGALMHMPACNGGRNPAAMKVQVAALAKDLGAKGNDPVFGAGLFRIAAPNTK